MLWLGSTGVHELAPKVEAPVRRFSVAVALVQETFEILMGVYARAGQHERATAAHRLMLSSGLKPTKPVLQMLLKAYCSAETSQLPSR